MPGSSYCCCAHLNMLKVLNVETHNVGVVGKRGTEAGGTGFCTAKVRRVVLGCNARGIHRWWLRGPSNKTPNRRREEMDAKGPWSHCGTGDVTGQAFVRASIVIGAKEGQGIVAEMLAPLGKMWLIRGHPSWARKFLELLAH